MQHVLFEPPSTWTPPDPATLPEWPRRGRVAVDLETWDPNLKTTGPSVRTGGHIAGFSFAIEGGPEFYLPIAHKGGGNLDEAQITRYMAHNLKRFEGELVGTNLAYDLDWLWYYGLRTNASKYLDVMVASALINEHRRSHSLDANARRYLNETKVRTVLDEAADTFFPGRESGDVIALLHSKYVGAYATADSSQPLRILRKQEKEIEEQELDRVWNLESRVLPAIVAMKQRGVRVDKEQLQVMENKCLEMMGTWSSELAREASYRVRPTDAMKSDIIRTALRRCDVHAPESIDKDWLSSNSHKHKAINCVLQLRRWSTLLNLSVASVKRHLVGDRIHCNFNQVRDGKRGARYGRFSCSNPNMQHQPKRGTEGAAEWRKVYIAEDEEEWCSLDYSQQEPRLLVHFAELAKLPRADEVGARYRDNPDMDFHGEMSAMASILRDHAKIIFLGLCYGMGVDKLKKQLSSRGGEGGDATTVFRKFHSGVPFVAKLSELAGRVAKQRGYVKTLSGRRCRFPASMSSHKALNRIIQGSAADQTKEAMACAHEAGLPVNLQVHDELNISVSDRKVGQQLKEIMLDCVTLVVPSKVDVGYAQNWGEV